MPVALIVGGAEQVQNEYARARVMCGSEPVAHFLINDQIALFEAVEAEGVTLHPAKLPNWLARRQAAKLTPLLRIWGHRPAPLIDRTANDWCGSGGLFAVKIALLERGFRKIVLCGVPMLPEAGHVVRRQRWNAAIGYHKGWKIHRAEIAPFVRSCSGWTADLLGQPTPEWLKQD